jgi:hypothetical protein
MDADTFAERARAELRASGGSARKRADPRDNLTPQEALPAAPVAARPTPDRHAAVPQAHGRRLPPAEVFTKRGIRSGSQLASVLPAPPRTPPQRRRPAS